eukprot:GFUD01015675.1.p1 GENE.GFUD01015675.1~~GFUD01015675.1.p1  ORF type:complete len:320 (-),score=80.47 GFUD01015675.1:523-1482(-)
MCDFNVWSYLAKMGVSVRGPGLASMAEGDKVAGMDSPTFLSLEDIEELLHVDYAQFSCQVPGCNYTFSQLHQSETHYNAVHRHSCSVCRRSLPSPHLLEIHIQESHDSFFAVLAERKPSYQCFLPTCPHLSWNASERHDHVIKIHKFPPDFRFDQVKKKGSEKRKEKKAAGGGDSAGSQAVTRRPLSLARLGEKFPNKDDLSPSKRSSICVDTPTSISGPLVKSPWNGTSPDVSRPPDQNIVPSPSSGGPSSSSKRSKIPVRSNSCRVPRNLSFGAGVAKTFIRPRSKHWHQTGSAEMMDTQTNIEKTDLNILRNALPD